MFRPLLLLAISIFVQSQEPAKPVETGIIAGSVTAPPDQTITEPVQVILLSAEYSNLFSRDLQLRLDTYWERYKPAFTQKKEFFFEIARMAHRDALQSVILRMRRDMRNDISGFVRATSNDGKFEFTNVPLGEYRIFAVGKIGPQDVIWTDTFEIKNSIPQFLELKNRLP
jgi:hypothetical protein